MPQKNVIPKLVRLCPEQWDTLQSIADSREVSVQKLLREAVAEFTHVPDSATSYRRRPKRKPTTET